MLKNIAKLMMGLLMLAVVFIGYIPQPEYLIELILTAPTMTMMYLLFDCTRYKFTGEFVYGFIKPEELTLDRAIIAAIIIYIERHTKTGNQEKVSCFFAPIFGILKNHRYYAVQRGIKRYFSTVTQPTTA